MYTVAISVLVMVAAVCLVGMANEVSFSAGLVGSKNGVTVNFGAVGVQDMAGNVLFSNVQNIGTSTEALDFGEAAPGSIGYIALKNLDPTNFIDIGLNTPLTQKLITLKPGKVAIFPPSVTTIYALANTGACNLQVVMVEA